MFFNRGLSRRHAIYYAPEPGTKLACFGERWLGRNVSTGEALTMTEAGIGDVIRQRVTQAPAIYGWHATLKPPFQLREGASRLDLVAALAEFARRTEPIIAPPLQLARLPNFAALVLTAPSKELETLAAECVRQFDHFRAEPDEDELARRRKSPLTQRQLDHLEQWGYPYVLDDWQFHMSLTGSISETDLAAVMQALLPFSAVWDHEVLNVTSLCLFEQPGPGAPFRLAERFPLGDATA